MSGRRKPRDPDAVKPSGMTLADYHASGALDVELPKTEYVVITTAGEFSVHPLTPEGKAAAEHQADKHHGTVQTRNLNPSSYWKTGETHYDH